MMIASLIAHAIYRRSLCSFKHIVFGAIKKKQILYDIYACTVNKCMYVCVFLFDQERLDKNQCTKIQRTTKHHAHE